MICLKDLVLLLYFQLHLTAYALYTLTINNNPHNCTKIEIFWFTGYEQKLFHMQYLLVCLFHYWQKKLQEHKP